MKYMRKIILFLFIIFILFGLTSCKKVSKVDSYTLCEQINSILSEYKKNGKQKEIEEKWYNIDVDEVFDFEALEGENGTLNIGTCLIGAPFAYVKDGNVTGLCFEYLYELCVRYGYNAKISSFSSVPGLLAAIETGKIDIAADTISITDERKESVSFTESFFDNGIVCIKRYDNDSVTSPEDLAGKKVAVLTGSILDTIVLHDCEQADIKYYNNVTDYIIALEESTIDAAYLDLSIFNYVVLTHPSIVKAYVSNSDDKYAFVVKKFGYQCTNELKNTTIGILDGSVYEDLAEDVISGAETSTYADVSALVFALKNNKIDSFIIDKALVSEAKKENEGIYTFDSALTSVETGAVFPKNSEGYERKVDFDKFIDELNESGKLEELINKWENYEEGVTKKEFVPKIDGSTKILRVSICASMAPYTFIENNEYTGLEIDIINLYARSRGLYIVYDNMEWGSLISSLSHNDMAISCIIKTDEREETLYFSKTLFYSEVVFVTMCNKEKKSSFFTSIVNSFYKTFVKEDRWKLFLDGALITLLITFASSLIGLLFGFILYLLADKLGYRMKSIMKVISAILNFIPVVVTLMIFYYIIFGKSNISNVVVSIIVFGILFGISTYSMLNTCVMAIDKGQYEASYSLGYSKNKTFFKVILPQTLPQFLLLLKNELVSHLKATAIVGYIAVEDLTKMSDIVRSRTYESFFPLIATAIIYFGLACVLISFVKKVNVSIDPKHRSIKKILKGVEEYD